MYSLFIRSELFFVCNDCNVSLNSILTHPWIIATYSLLNNEMINSRLYTRHLQSHCS